MAIPDRVRAAWAQLAELWQQPEPKAEIVSFPAPRRLILDVLAAGQKKSIAHVLFDADISGVKDRLAAHRHQTGQNVSLTSYIAKSFASAVAADKRLQAYRLGRSRIILFDEVDMAFMIERSWEGEQIPLFYIVRNAQTKTAHEINEELRLARDTPLGTTGPLNALELQVALLPQFLRRFIWFLLRRNPYWFKSAAGTVGLSSFGMHTSGAAVGVPITPMSLTLVVGTIEKKLVSDKDEQIVEQEFVHMCLSMDHDVIDGAPSMRLIERLKASLQNGEALSTSPADGS